MDRSSLAGGSAGRRGRAEWPPAGPRGPVRGRSLGLLQDVKRTIGRVNGGWPHEQSQAGRFDSCLSQRPPPALPRERGRVIDLALLIDGEAALDPGGRATVDVADRVVPELQQVAGRRQAPLPAVADGQNRTIAWHFVDALLQRPQRDQLSPGDVTLLIFPRLPDIQEVGRRLGPHPL